MPLKNYLEHQKETSTSLCIELLTITGISTSVGNLMLFNNRSGVALISELGFRAHLFTWDSECNIYSCDWVPYKVEWRSYIVSLFHSSNSTEFFKHFLVRYWQKNNFWGRCLFSLLSLGDGYLSSGDFLVQPPSSKQGHLELIAQDCVQSDSEYLHSWILWATCSRAWSHSCFPGILIFICFLYSSPSDTYIHQ